MDPDDVGLALIVGGAALVCCGLIFIVPVRCKRKSEQEEIEEMDQWPANADHHE